MLYLFLSDESVLELPNTSIAKVEGDDLVCFNEQGREIARYDKLKVQAYGKSPSLKEFLQEQEQEGKTGKASDI
jgi:hypothetical protein